jgi:prepilin-type N-terminal cleavage/methylation domain-containing protein
MRNNEMERPATFATDPLGFRMSPSKRSPSCAGMGFTLLELMIAIMIVGTLVLIGIHASKRPREEALLASCISFHVAIQQSLFSEYALNGEYPNSLDDILAYFAQFEGNDFALNTEFAYAGGEDANKGHGNDWDDSDSDNTGKKKDLSDGEAGYYLRCNHNHSFLKVLFVDSGAYVPPKAIYDEADARGDVK